MEFVLPFPKIKSHFFLEKTSMKCNSYNFTYIMKVLKFSFYSHWRAEKMKIVSSKINNAF